MQEEVGVVDQHSIAPIPLRKLQRPVLRQEHTLLRAALYLADAQLAFEDTGFGSHLSHAVSIVLCLVQVVAALPSKAVC